jgi:hypothetical protein
MIRAMRPTNFRPTPERVPQRKRVMVIGATAAGVSAAFHLGNTSLLLEQCPSSGEINDCSNDFAVGDARYRVVGSQGPDARGARQGIGAKECQGLNETAACEEGLTPFARWKPPEFVAGTDALQGSPDFNLHGLSKWIGTEVRLGARVIKIDTYAHRLELSSGDSFVYDKLISSLSLATLKLLMVDEMPRRIHGAQSWRYWFSGRDIELVDPDTCRFHGEVNGASRGKRVADHVRRELNAKYAAKPSLDRSANRLFRPWLVSSRQPG